MENFTQDFYTSRRNYDDGTDRIGQLGRLWYDSQTNTIRVGNGTPGGLVVSASGTGGGAIEVKSEGVTLTETATSIDFTGNGIFATHLGDGQVVVNVTVPTSSFDGGSPFSDFTVGLFLDAGGVT